MQYSHVSVLYNRQHILALCDAERPCHHSQIANTNVLPHCSGSVVHLVCGPASINTAKAVATRLTACCALQYYDDTARVLRSVVLSAIAPHRLTAAPKPMPLAFATPEAAKGVSQGSLLELTGVIAEEGEGMYADSEGDLYERWVPGWVSVPDRVLLWVWEPLADNMEAAYADSKGELHEGWVGLG